MGDWQTVPKVLTDAMLEAARQIDDGPLRSYQEHWDMMLAAAASTPPPGHSIPEIGEPVADKIDLDFEPAADRPLSPETLAQMAEIDAHRRPHSIPENHGARPPTASPAPAPDWLWQALASMAQYIDAAIIEESWHLQRVSVPHIRDMRDQMCAPGFDRDKALVWLGWIQGALEATGNIEPDRLDAINRAAKAASPAPASTPAPDLLAMVSALEKSLNALELVRRTVAKEGGVDLTHEQMARIINDARDEAHAAITKAMERK